MYVYVYICSMLCIDFVKFSENKDKERISTRIHAFSILLNWARPNWVPVTC